MSSNAIAFIEYSYNRYSLSVLTGVLEEDARFQELDILFLKSRKKKLPADERNKQLREEIISLASQYEKLVVAFSFPTPNVIQIAYTISELRKAVAKHHIDNTLFIAGGPHPSGDPLGTLEMGIDCVVVGEGEVTLPKLLGQYFDEKNYSQIRGISFFDESGDYRYTGRPAPIDLSNYPAFGPKHRRFSPIEISRGCPWGCKFCQTPFLMGGRMRHRSIGSIVKYARIAKDHGLRDLRFITPASFAYGSSDGRTINLETLEIMLKAVSEIFGKDHVYLGSFPSEVRPENVSPETLALVKKYCANNNIIIGSQSGSDSMLKAIHRGHDVEDVIQAVKLIIEAELTANVDFIFGMPNETQEDIDKTLELMNNLTGMGARVHSHTFMPLVGTPFSNAEPGVVDKKTRRLLNRLRGKGLEYGQWEKQETLAQESIEFITSQLDERQPHLQNIIPLRPR